MTLEQIKRLSDKQIYTITENILLTHNLVNIQQVKGKDLEITDTDKYDYIMCYSFPCQDLSNAGLGKGMSDTSTRSGMLWEVERILTECKELGELPQILLMENVPMIHSSDNVEDFNKWQLRLEELGYKNYWEDLIATDYGIPQTRNRCFMVSILGDYSYSFPPKQPLKLKLKDLLEDNVDEKYFLSDAMINYISSRMPTGDSKITTGINMGNRESFKKAGTITTGEGGKPSSNYIIENEDYDYSKEECRIIKKEEFIPIRNATKKGYLEAKEGDGVDISSRMEYHRGTVQKDKVQTLTTMGGEDYGVVVGTYQFAKSDNFMNGKDRFQLGKETSDTLQTAPKEAVVTLGNYHKSNHNASRIVDKEHSAPTVMENHGTITATQISDLRIRKLTPRECGRLQGVKDSDITKLLSNQSNASAYHLFGDAITVPVLCAIFGELLQIDYKSIIERWNYNE